MFSLAPTPPAGQIFQRLPKCGVNDDAGPARVPHRTNAVAGLAGSDGDGDVQPVDGGERGGPSGSVGTKG